MIVIYLSEHNDKSLLKNEKITAVREIIGAKWSCSKFLVIYKYPTQDIASLHRFAVNESELYQIIYKIE